MGTTDVLLDAPESVTNDRQDALLSLTHRTVIYMLRHQVRRSQALALDECLCIIFVNGRFAVMCVFKRVCLRVFGML
jgi:hypothetical protein